MPPKPLKELQAKVAGWVWGLDTGNKRVGLGCVELATGRFATYAAEWRREREKTPLPLAQSLRLASQHTHDLARAVVFHRSPLTIAVEQASGRNRALSLLMHGGVELDALTVATGLHPWLITVSRWKANVSGSGSWPKSALLPWLRELGYPLDDVDQAAGLAIAAGAAVELYGFDVSLLHPATPPARRAA